MTLTAHELYRVWTTMRQRCSNPKATGYYLYGGLGVRVCDRWSDFANFLADMGERPSKGHSLDRYPNQNGSYEPGNVRWATRKEQNRNLRNNTFVVIEGARHKLIDLIDATGVNEATIRKRIRRGYTLAEVCSKERLPMKLDGLALGVEAHRVWKKAKTHCKNGHEWTPENTHITPDGHRRCRACDREQAKRYALRHQ